MWSVLSMVLAYNKALTVKLWRRVTEQCSFYLLMTSAAVLRRLDRDCGAEITWSQLFPTQASPSVSVEEMVDSSCFCVKKKKNRKWVKTRSLQTISRRWNGKHAGNVCVWKNNERERERVREFDFIWLALWESSHAKFVFMHRTKPASLGCSFSL